MTSDNVINYDLKCAKCKYNLRGLNRIDSCPECGMSILYSLDRVNRKSIVRALFFNRRARRILVFFVLSLFGSYGLQIFYWFAIAGFNSRGYRAELLLAVPFLFVHATIGALIAWLLMCSALPKVKWTPYILVVTIVMIGYGFFLLMIIHGPLVNWTRRIDEYLADNLLLGWPLFLWLVLCACGAWKQWIAKSQ